MTPHKARHCLLGLIITLVGLISIRFNFLHLKPVYYFVVAFGFLWAMVPGHLPFVLGPILKPIVIPVGYLFFSILFPMYSIRFFILNPVRIKRDTPICCVEWFSILTNWGDPIVAYNCCGNTLTFVADPDDSAWLATWIAYRSQRVMKKAISKLKAFAIREVYIDQQHIRKALHEISESYPRVKEVLDLDINSTAFADFMDNYMGRIDDFYRSHPHSVATLLVWHKRHKQKEYELEPKTLLGQIYYDE
ncbi:MAG: hypothetical protein JSW12_00880 [Deltaproteobacteria bacterium]|nr:MAG: hypothetical protein JSW12_00880 [Deltaproteobacteria bacterium]